MEATENREMRITRTFHSPIDLMWEAWTNPEHIVHWWGPNGFTNTILKMDFQEGGEWKFTMHGPDGTNYPNRSIFKEIIPLQKIVFEHFNPHFIATILFESKGEETQVDWTMLFDTVEMHEIIVKSHKADEGQKQNLERLQLYLSKLRMTHHNSTEVI
ncbi:SRPBCC family protein [Chitinophagaceae bacterium LB-8]|uniref:SRPBCC family protein n=1 Tax=Paraflavisolibacter caeni TaxID=2982496 RepID=A0A9X3BG19_9BACT|nr:SRPBCC family protein [Paraflavisolibacter caeni]MCU7550119.1 SRPBCC family protein [Paraflavisolibacter caeni]